MVKNYVSFFELIFLVILVVLPIIRSNVFESIAFPAYKSVRWAQFMIFVRCGINREASKNSDQTFRALFENAHLNLLRYIFYPIMFTGTIDMANLLLMAKTTAICTLGWQMIPDRIFYEFRYIWCYFVTEYLISLPYLFLEALNKFTITSNGNLLSLMLLVYFECVLLFKGAGSMLSPSPFSKRVMPFSLLYYFMVVVAVYYLQAHLFEDKITFNPPLRFWDDFFFGYRPHITGYRMITNFDADHFFIFAVPNYMNIPFILFAQISFLNYKYDEERAKIEQEENAQNTQVEQVKVSVKKEDPKKQQKKEAPKEEEPKKQPQQQKEQAQKGNQGKKKKNK